MITTHRENFDIPVNLCILQNTRHSTDVYNIALIVFSFSETVLELEASLIMDA